MSQRIGYKQLKPIVDAARPKDEIGVMSYVPEGVTAFALAKCCYEFYWSEMTPPETKLNQDEYYRLYRAIHAMYTFLGIAFVNGKTWPEKNHKTFSRAVRLYWDFVLRRDPTWPRRVRTVDAEQLELEV